MFIAALFTIAKTWNQPKCLSMIDWTKKMWHIYTMEYYAAIKNDEFMSFVGTWMKLDKENVAHVHHRILCSHKKGRVHVLYRDMDEAENPHSQQTNTRTENQTPPFISKVGVEQ